jgi:hypothetical protein
VITAEILARRLRDEGLDDYSGIYCTEEGLASLCGSSDRTVRRWRARGVGPQYIRLSKILYDLEAVACWLNAGGLQKVQRLATSGRE